MIVQALFDPIFTLIQYIISLIPDFPENFTLVSDVINILRVPLSIFPLFLWKLFFANIVFWITLDFTWVIIEWVYKKIPGIN